MNLATARPTFASPHNKRQRKRFAVFKRKETSHELFLNGQTNALHLHTMNGPYYSKSNCRLWNKRRLVAECLSETRKLVTRESACFPTQQQDTGLPGCPEEMAFCQPWDWTRTAKPFYLATGHLTGCIAHVCAGGAEGKMQNNLRASPSQGTGQMQCCVTQYNGSSP